MASRISHWSCILAVVSFAVPARAQVDGALDCGLANPVTDGATAPLCGSLVGSRCLAADGGPVAPNPLCETPASYSSAMNCCGVIGNAECAGIQFGIPNCNAQCGHGYCLPAAGLPSQYTSFLADCPPAADGAPSGMKCIPNAFIENLGNVHFRTCDSLQGVTSTGTLAAGEGRCVPSCLDAVPGSIKNFLPSAGCLASEVCAPCWDPRNGTATGACSIGCDPGPDSTKPVVTFPPCCPVTADGATTHVGMCVPQAVVPNQFWAVLGQADCATSGLLCVPLSLDTSALASFACFQPPTPPDAGLDASAGAGGDASVGPDGSLGGTVGSGGAVATGGATSTQDAGVTGRRSSLEGGCGCRTATAPSPTGMAGLLALGVGAALGRARRRVRSSRQ